MYWFTEKFVEDCIAEAPRIFLGRDFRLYAQQPKLGGFRPDLLFLSDDERIVIVEIQKAALDRYHLYKCLEYRDLFFAKEGGKLPHVILLCDELPIRYQSIIATHGIELLLFSAQEFLEKATLSCPRALSKHLVKAANFGFRPLPRTYEPLARYAWRASDDLFDVLAFVTHETAKAGAKERLDRKGEYDSLLFQGTQLLSDPHSTNKILNPEEWNIDKLISKPKQRIPREADILRIRKPEIRTYVYVTSKGNLTLRWEPTGDRYARGDHDWIRAPSNEPYAYERPENELLFVKGIQDVWPDPERHRYHKDCEERAAFDSMIVGLVCAMIKHIHDVIGRTVVVHQSSYFRPILGCPISTKPFWTRHEVIGWE